MTTNPNCFVIAPTTTTLQDFIGYSLLVDPTNSLVDTNSMDAFLLARFDNNTQYISGFRTFFDCANWNGNNQRFHLSFFEGELVFLSQNNASPCPPPANGPNAMLCQSTCQLAQQSLSNIFTNPNFCNQSPSTTIASNRASTLASYHQICTSLPATTSNCIQTIAIEKNSCGFIQQSDAAAFCSPSGQGILSNDPCCQLFLKGTGTGTITMNAGPPSSNGGTVTTTIAIVVGLVGGLAIIGGLYMFIAYRRKRVQIINRDAEVFPSSSANGSGGGFPGPKLNSPVDVFQSQATVSTFNNSNARDRSGSSDPILPFAAGPGMKGPSGGGINSSNGNFDDEFDYDPVKSMPTNLARDSEILSILEGEEGDGGGRNVMIPARSAAYSVYSEAPSQAYTGTNYTNKYSIYSEQDGREFFNGTMDSSAREEFNNKYKSYASTSEAQSEYRPVSYVLPNGTQQTVVGNANVSGLPDPEEGMFQVKVLFAYEKDLPDELGLQPGDIVTVTNLFDDGWARGVCNGKQGAFPLACVVPLDSTEAAPRGVIDVLKRRSSLGTQ
ncbi:hypothetical protein HDU98_006180 [Podochytrium sp. JEL0797]|nr:hypothetical protein HDU98_006180 [Podochytrium sp. JEL0797]